MNARDEIFFLLRKTLCNGTTDCENSAECVNEGEMDGCPPLDLAQAILAKLPSLGFVRMEDVEISKTELMTKINDVCHEELEYVVYSKSDVMGWEKLVKRIAHAIAEAKGIIKVKEGR